MLSPSIIRSINKSVLCWLATATKEGIPNVSPKEVFTHYNTELIIIANIASPQTVKNIRENEHVCISFIDILVQKGYQLKGVAKIIDKKSEKFSSYENELLKITEGKYPFNTITEITRTKTKEIIAPRYILYPDTTEAMQIASAKKAYGLQDK